MSTFHVVFHYCHPYFFFHFRFTLTEQLLLTTACREMVISHSGYSGRAVEMRRQLMAARRPGKIYRFQDGIVT